MGFNRYEPSWSIDAHLFNTETTNVINLTQLYTIFVLVRFVVYVQNDEGTSGAEYPYRNLYVWVNPIENNWK